MSTINTVVDTSSQIADLAALKQNLQAQLRAAKEQGERTAWERARKAQNPAYVVGSLRAATDADILALGHSHGWVCEIKCVSCSKRRVINKQDAFQCRACLGCKAELKKAQAKERRQAVTLASVTPEQLQAEIERLQALLTVKAS